jgi:hypothetical protein
MLFILYTRRSTFCYRELPNQSSNTPIANVEVCCNSAGNFLLHGLGINRRTGYSAEKLQAPGRGINPRIGCSSGNYPLPDEESTLGLVIPAEITISRTRNQPEERIFHWKLPALNQGKCKWQLKEKLIWSGRGMNKIWEVPFQHCENLSLYGNRDAENKIKTIVVQNRYVICTQRSKEVFWKEVLKIILILLKKYNFKTYHHLLYSKKLLCTISQAMNALSSWLILWVFPALPCWHLGSDQYYTSFRMCNRGLTN